MKLSLEVVPVVPVVPLVVLQRLSGFISYRTTGTTFTLLIMMIKYNVILHEKHAYIYIRESGKNGLVGSYTDED